MLHGYPMRSSKVFGGTLLFGVRIPISNNKHTKLQYYKGLHDFHMRSVPVSRHFFLNIDLNSKSWAPVPTRAFNPGVVSSNPNSANIMFDVW